MAVNISSWDNGIFRHHETWRIQLYNSNWSPRFPEMSHLMAICVGNKSKNYTIDILFWPIDLANKSRQAESELEVYRPICG